jgi:hypothetical protein
VNVSGSEHEGAGGSAAQLSITRKYSDTVVPLVALVRVSSVFADATEVPMVVVRAPPAVVAYFTSASVSPHPVPLKALVLPYILSVISEFVFSVSVSGDTVSSYPFAKSAAVTPAAGINAKLELAPILTVDSVGTFNRGISKAGVVQRLFELIVHVACASARWTIGNSTVAVSRAT